MPQFDSTGPKGEGSGTGKGHGKCSGKNKHHSVLETNHWNKSHTHGFDSGAGIQLREPKKGCGCSHKHE